MSKKEAIPPQTPNSIALAPVVLRNLLIKKGDRISPKIQLFFKKRTLYSKTLTATTSPRCIWVFELKTLAI